MELNQPLEYTPSIAEKDLQDILVAYLGEDHANYDGNLATIIKSGSIRLYEDTHPETRQATIQARKYFFEDVLGWGDDDHQLNASYRNYEAFAETLIPLDTFVSAQAFLVSKGVDVRNTFKVLPSSISYSLEGVRSKITNFEDLGSNPAKVLKALPAALSFSIDSVNAKMQNLEEHKLNATKVVNKFPSILSISQQSIDTKLANLARLGLDSTKIANATPSVIGLSSETVEMKLSRLRELGLNSVLIANSYPATLSLSPDSIAAKVDGLSDLGFNAIGVVNTCPSILTLSLEGIRTKISALTELGAIKSAADIPLNSAAQINYFFFLPIESLLLYITHGSASSLEIDKIGLTARKFTVDKLGVKTTSERKALYLESLPQVHSKLGMVAIEHALYMTIPKEGLKLNSRI